MLVACMVLRALCRMYVQASRKGTSFYLNVQIVVYCASRNRRFGGMVGEVEGVSKACRKSNESSIQ